MVATTDDVREWAARGSSSKFFDPETMRWWKSRLLSDVLESRDSILFMTSDDPFGHGRVYTVRVVDPSGHITTLAQQLPDRSRAKSLQNAIAADAAGNKRPFSTIAKELLADLGIEQP